MISRWGILFTLMIFSCKAVWSQDNPIHLDPLQYEQLERLLSKYPGKNPIFPSFHTLSRKKIAEYLLTLPFNSMDPKDLDVARHFVNDSPEWFTDTAFLARITGGHQKPDPVLIPKKNDPWLNTFYPYPGELIFTRKKDFFMAINPILQWKYGRQRDGNPTIFENRKGVSLRLGIEDKIFVDTKIEDIQLARPMYISRYTDRYSSIPGFTFYSGYRSSIFPSIRGRDVLDGQAALTVPIGKYAFTRFGYSRQFIGNGIQSLLMSDFGGNYLHLDLNLQIWKLKYRYMIAELAGLSARQVRGDQLLPKKFMATHLLQFRLWNQGYLGLFESVVFNRKQQLEWHYLLPVIFFRTVERTIGSPDNILLGLDFKTTLSHQVDLYSQFVLDEFKTTELFGSNHWWGNKWGIQVGARWYDVLGLENLNATAEYNTVRPYTYSHRDSLAAYTHYNSPLAHPLGANFREFIGRLDFHPHNRWQLFGLLYHNIQGVDLNEENYGANIRKSSYSRPFNYGVRTLQGRKVRVTGFQGGISYMLWHDAWLDLNLGLRREDENNNVWGGVAFRLKSGRTGLSIF